MPDGFVATVGAPALAAALALVAGAALGVVFFGGLWITARRGARSAQPATWFAGSLLLRMAIVLPGFYLVGGGNWERLAACLLGFVLARVLVSRATRPGRARAAAATRRAGDAA